MDHNVSHTAKSEAKVMVKLAVRIEISIVLQNVPWTRRLKAYSNTIGLRVGVRLEASFDILYDETTIKGTRTCSIGSIRIDDGM